MTKENALWWLNSEDIKDVLQTHFGIKEPSETLLNNCCEEVRKRFGSSWYDEVVYILEEYNKSGKLK